MNKKANVWVLAVVGVVAVVALSVLLYSGNHVSAEPTGAIFFRPLVTPVNPLVIVEDDSPGEAIVLATNISVYIQNLPGVTFGINDIKVDRDVTPRQLYDGRMKIFVKCIGEEVLIMVDNRIPEQLTVAQKISGYLQKINNTRNGVQYVRPRVNIVTYDNLRLSHLNPEPQACSNTMVMYVQQRGYP